MNLREFHEYTGCSGLTCVELYNRRGLAIELGAKSLIKIMDSYPHQQILKFSGIGKNLYSITLDTGQSFIDDFIAYSMWN